VHDEDSHNTNNNNNNNNMKDLHDNKEDAHEKAAQTHSDKNKNVKNVHDSKKDDDKKDSHKAQGVVALAKEAASQEWHDIKIGDDDKKSKSPCLVHMSMYIKGFKSDSPMEC
jgi:hypothetical protein